MVAVEIKLNPLLISFVALKYPRIKISNFRDTQAWPIARRQAVPLTGALKWTGTESGKDCK